MNSNGLVSIVVPIYNGEDYVGQMIESLLKQSYQNIEVLIVNDYSMDRSIEIIKECVKEDSRFIILDADHKLGTAVKGQEYALQYCRGEYYFFLSQDDFIDPDLIRICIDKSVEMGAEVVIPNCIRYYGGSSEFHGKYPLNGDYRMVLEPKDAYELSLTWQIHGFSLKKMSLVKKVGIVGTYYNSCEYYHRISLLKANKIVFADTNFYYRLNNPNAITQSLKYFHVDILKTDVMLLRRFCKEKYGKRKCLKRYKSLIGGWLSWWMTAIKNRLLFQHKCYVLKMLFSVQLDLIILLPQILLRG